jgi:hypothetical protein
VQGSAPCWLTGRRRLAFALPAILLAAPLSADPFADLSAAYRARDPKAAAAAYAPDATVTYRYDGVPEERHTGAAAIAESFRKQFEMVDRAIPLDLHFRFISRTASAATGVYRFTLGPDASHGRFAVTFAPDGRFATDLSTSATEAEYQALPPSVR